MKRILKLSVVTIALICSCSQDPVNPDPVIDPNPDIDPNPEVLTPADVQKKIETTSSVLLDEIQTSTFSPLFDLIEYFVETYINEDIDYSELETNYQKVIEDALTQKKEEGYDRTTKTYYIDTFEKFILNIYDYKGEVMAGTKKWTYQVSDGFSLEFKDQFGKTCSIGLTPKGSIGKVFMSYSSRYRRYVDYDINGDGIVDYENYEEHNENRFYAYIPESLEMSMKQGSEEIVTAEYKLSSNLADFDIVEDSSMDMLQGLKMDFSASFSCYDYTFKIERLYYDGKEVQENIMLAHNEKTLLSESLSLHDFTLDEKSPYMFKGGKCDASVDILGDIKFVATVTDAYNLLCAAVDVDSYSGKPSSNELSSAIDKLNRYYIISMYVDGKDSVQATVEFRPFKENSNYYAEPVIVFDDGSSFSFEDYFGGEYFKDLEKRVENIVKDFVNMTDF